jgi:predicted phosphodiesterase
MSSPLDDLKKIQDQREDARRPKRKHPEGWEPGVAWDENSKTGSITVQQNKPRPDWDSLLREWGFDPEQFEIADDTIQFRTWDANTGEGNVQRMYYYRAQIRTRSNRPDADVEALIQEIKKHKPTAVNSEEEAGDTALLVAISDTQMGKGEGGGSAAVVDRFNRGIDLVESRWRELVKAGRNLDRIVVCGLGDLIESTDGHYAMQGFQVDLDRRDQVKVMRRLLVKALERWSKLAPRVIVAAVPGNHGENRKNGKAYTTFGDNDDLAVFEQVAEILAANPERYGHVSFVIAGANLTLTIDVHGTIVGLAHGHQARSGGQNPIGKIANWWKGQSFGERPAGDANLLLTGHFHSLQVATHGPKTHIQAPSLDGGSQWFTEITGIESPGGLLTLTVGKNGWDDLKVLNCE